MQRASLKWPGVLCLSVAGLIIVNEMFVANHGGADRGGISYTIRKQAGSWTDGGSERVAAVAIQDTNSEETAAAATIAAAGTSSRVSAVATAKDEEATSPEDAAVTVAAEGSSQANVSATVTTEEANSPKILIADENEGAKLSTTTETNKAVDFQLLESVDQASFIVYTDLPLNGTCEKVNNNGQGCQPCQTIQYMMDYLKSRETNSSHPDLILIPLDFLASLPEEAPGFSDLVRNVVNYVVHKDTYIKFGGSNHIFICLFPGCKRVLKEILDKHQLGKKTRAMWMGMQSDLEEQRDLWPCPNRVITAPPAISRIVENSLENSLCGSPNRTVMAMAMASILDRGAGLIEHTNRWMCSRSQWNVNLDLLRGSWLKGCILIERHNMCVAIIPKCGSSSMIHVLRRMEGVPEWNNTHHRTHDQDNGMKWIHPAQFDEYTRILLSTNILKVALVRDPADRLLSGYSDKIYHLREFYRLNYLGKTIPTLEWVVDKLAEVQKQGRLNRLDEHFRPMIDFGSMRHIDYDYFARVGSMAEDLEVVLSSLGLWKAYGASGWGVNEDLSFGEYAAAPKEYVGFNTGKGVPPEVHWTPALLEKVHKIYEDDYRRFGFRMD